MLSPSPTSVSPKHAPNPRDHSLGGCEKAKSPTCDCQCHGASHQSTVLREAVRTADDVPERGRTTAVSGNEFQDLLTEVFGQKFFSLDAPKDDQIPRRTWNPDAKTGGQRSQREQRIVDVTLRDVLEKTFELPDSAKRSWLAIVDALTLKNAWVDFAGQLDNLGLQTNSQSGFFWSALLAALSATTPHIKLAPFHPGTADAESVGDAIRRVITEGKDHAGQRIPRYDVFGMWCMPRTGIPTPISEIGHPKAVEIAAELVARAATLAADQGMSQQEFMLLTQIVGAAVSADLWHQPASVRYLLIPAAAGLRRAASLHRRNIPFSLDGQIPDVVDSKMKKADRNTATGSCIEKDTVEYLITEELGMRWRIRQHWGPASPLKGSDVSQVQPEG